MNDLHDELEVIRELNLLRDRAKDLREKGVRPLLNIKSIEYSTDKEGNIKKDITEKVPQAGSLNNWFRSGNEIEVALVVKIQNHPDLSLTDGDIAEATPELKNRLRKLKVKEFFPEIKDAPASIFDAQPTVAVMMAARAMQTLVNRSNMVFSEAAMYCYYRIIRELYVAEPMDKMVGGARAGSEGKTSAFVTGECVRAIFSFEDAIKRTARFFKLVKRLNIGYWQLNTLVESLGEAGRDARHPLRRWADSASERMWLDFQIATNLRGGQIAHFFNSKEKKFGINQPNELLPKDIAKPRKAGQTNPVTLKTVKAYLDSLKENLPKAVARAQTYLKTAESEIENFRNENENPYDYASGIPALKPEYIEPTPENRGFINSFHRTESAHLTALQMVKNAVAENNEVIEIIENINDDFNKTLELLVNKAEKISQRIHRVAEPIKQYIKTVIRREFAEATTPSASAFDPGELVFAATAYGTMTDWKPSELLNRACQLLRDALPESGRLATKRPLHSSQHGYRLLPIGCEMTRCLAQLFQKTNYEIDPVLITRMLNIFEEKLIPLSIKKGEEMCGWNYESAPHPNKPSVWVSAVTVLALDRIVRMLNARINNAILKHFDVYYPQKPHSNLTLNDLIYSDFGFSLHDFYSHKVEVYKKLSSIPVSLELMRAHVTRSSLPKNYINARMIVSPIFSVIFYGPPGTGKTTLAEATALSSKVPVVNLSPNDLLVQGQQFIEGRARDVFDALSMLTQVVIILDEFEPILERRISEDAVSVKASPPQNSSENALTGIADYLKEISQQVDPQFKFLVAGMLPRLLKLHDAAKKQSTAYCLATNHLRKIDDAAKRTGRFDLTIPVYHPCPLSRAGILLLRLVKINPNLKLEGETLKRFVEVLAHTTNEPASELAGNYFKYDEDKFISKSDYLDYILSQKHNIKLDFKKADRMVDLETNKNKLETYEFNERIWLIEFEKKLQPEAGKPDPNLKALLTHRVKKSIAL